MQQLSRPPTAVVTPLPIGSGGDSTTSQQMNEANYALTMMTAQSQADSKFDPIAPPPKRPLQQIERFCSGYRSNNMKMVSYALYGIGGLCIVYGVLAK
jgi:hypothetical protein